MSETTNVFISHSWVQTDLAQAVAARMTAIGVRPILDKDEVAAGDDVEDRLRKLLEESHELLMLCSKESLASAWVMLEVGAAWARGIRISPVIVDDTAVNDLPGVLNRRSVLRWDEVESYYGQLQKRAGDGYAAPVEPAATGPFPAFGRQAVIDGPDEDIRDDIGWKAGMERYRGRTARITKIDSGDGSVLLDVDKGDYWWAIEWLRPLAS